MLSLLQQKDKHYITVITYGSNVTNTYIQISQILKRVKIRPQPAPTVLPQSIPAPAPRVQLSPTQPPPGNIHP